MNTRTKQMNISDMIEQFSQISDVKKEVFIGVDCTQPFPLHEIVVNGNDVVFYSYIEDSETDSYSLKETDKKTMKVKNVLEILNGLKSENKDYELLLKREYGEYTPYLSKLGTVTENEKDVLLYYTF